MGFKHVPWGNLFICLFIELILVNDVDSDSLLISSMTMEISPCESGAYAGTFCLLLYGTVLCCLPVVPLEIFFLLLALLLVFLVFNGIYIFLI
jgi:hypothetical protein